MTSSLQIKPRRILFLVTNLTFGGAETQVVRLASEFKDRDWEVTVVSMMQPEIWVEQLRGRAIEVRTLGMDRGVPDFRAIFRLRRIVKELSPDVVHCHMFHANILGRIARLFCSMPVLVSTVHNLRETSERGGSTGWKELLYRITDRLATRTTIICQAAFDRYVKVRAVPAQRLEMIPNGIDVEAFRPDAEARARARQALGIDSQFVWLAVGRMVQQKDYPNLFRALTLIPNADYTVRSKTSCAPSASVWAWTAKCAFSVYARIFVISIMLPMHMSCLLSSRAFRWHFWKLRALSCPLLQRTRAATGR